jgi:hypothetical protein
MLDQDPSLEGTGLEDLPESAVLKAISLYRQQRYTEIEPLYQVFDARWKSRYQELEILLQRYKLGRTNFPEGIYYQYIHTNTLLSDWLPLTEDQDILELFGHIARVELDKKRLPVMMPWYKQVQIALGAEQNLLQRRAGKEILQKMLYQYEYLTDCYRQLGGARFEAAVALNDVQAIALLEEIAVWAPQEAAVRWVELGGEEPVAGYQRLMEQYPKSNEIRFLLGLSLWEAGKEEQAVAVLSGVKWPYSLEAQALIGRYFFYRQNWEAAKVAFQQGEDPYMLAWALWALGDKTAAIEAMQGAQNPQAAEDLKRFKAAAAQ